MLLTSTAGHCSTASESLQFSLLQAAEEKAKKSAQRWRRQAAEVQHLKDVELRLLEEVRLMSVQCTNVICCITRRTITTIQFPVSKRVALYECRGAGTGGHGIDTVSA
jgi:hypothetical protein